MPFLNYARFRYLKYLTPFCIVFETRFNDETNSFTSNIFYIDILNAIEPMCYKSVKNCVVFSASVITSFFSANLADIITI